MLMDFKKGDTAHKNPTASHLGKQGLSPNCLPLILGIMKTVLVAPGSFLPKVTVTVSVDCPVKFN